MTQTAFSRDMAAAFEGQDASVLEPRSTTGPVAQEAIKPGRLVARDTADGDDEGSLPDASAEVTARAFGVSLYDAKKEGGSEYAIGDRVLCLRKGEVWVKPEDAVVHGGQVFVRTTAGATLTELGRFRSDDGDEGGGALAVALPGARWETSGAADALTKISINLP